LFRSVQLAEIFQGQRMPSTYAVGMFIFLGLAGVASIGERVRIRRRRSAEQVGLMPWPPIFIFSLLLAAVFAGLWLRES
jgi:hypothetical protein